MTFRDLSSIIKKRKEQPLTSAIDRQEIVEALEAINTLRTNYYKAYHEREAKWEQEHPGKEFYQRTEEDNRRDSNLDEWFWDFFQRIRVSTSPEVRYRLERDPDHGFGHKSRFHGLEDQCIPGCRFYAPTGRLTIFDILGNYRGYQQFEDVWQAYKELEVERSLPPD